MLLQRRENIKNKLKKLYWGGKYFADFRVSRGVLGFNPAKGVEVGGPECTAESGTCERGSR